MLHRFGVAIGAGVASALLFVVTIQGTALAMALAYLAPLPIMIVTLGWGLDAGLIAMAVSGLVAGGAVDPISGVIFELTVALPAGVLAGLATLKNLRIFDRKGETRAPVRAGLGLIAVAGAAFGALVSAGAMTIMIVVSGGYDRGVQAFVQLLQPTIDEALSGGLVLPDDITADGVAHMIIRYAPAAIAASTTVMLLVNLYIAARSAQMSQRLNRPWLDIPTSLQLPAPFAVAAVAAGAAWFGAPEAISQFSATLAAPLFVLVVMQGLAVLHALSRRAPLRPALIGALYIACLVAPRFVLPAVALIGLIESFATLRLRAATRPFRT